MFQLVDLIMHIDQHLAEWTILYGPWIYALVFAIIFCETGLVVMPFLPGDSLLFALGAMTAIEGGLNLWAILIGLTIAGILGDTVNYHAGKYFGTRVFKPGNRILKPEYLTETAKFYERWGSFTIVVARFAPFARTFAPFVAGAGSMNYRRFLTYNVAGAMIWVFTFVLAGAFFGNLPVVKRNFHVVIFAVIFVSLLPTLIPLVKHRFSAKKVHPRVD